MVESDEINKMIHVMQLKIDPQHVEIIIDRTAANRDPKYYSFAIRYSLRLNLTK